MTGATCSATCAKLGFTVAGIEYGSECYCGNWLDNQPTKADDSKCSKACAGDATQSCGGSWLLTVYAKGTLKIMGPPAVVDKVDKFQSIGCWTDSSDARALMGKWPSLNKNTIQGCAAQCASYSYFGVEYGSEVRSPLVDSHPCSIELTSLFS
jgi:hypothetical protein